MAQITKVEAQAEIKSSADKFYGFFKNNMSSFVQMFPQILKSFEVVGGGQIRTGSVQNGHTTLVRDRSMCLIIFLLFFGN